MNTTPVYIGEQKVAEITDVSVQTLRNNRHLGKGFPYVKIGKSVRYNLEDVIRYMESRKIQTEAA